MPQVDPAVPTTLTTGIVLPTRAEVDPAITHWLLAATESRARARTEWQESGVTMLKTGTLFSAIRMSARLVHAAAGTTDTGAVDGYLVRALVGGPVIHDPDRCRYSALVPASTARRWTACRDAEALGRDAYVAVPRPGLTTADASTGGPYWSVSMESAGMLCVPAAVAALVEIGRYELAGQPPAVGTALSPLPGKGRR